MLLRNKENGEKANFIGTKGLSGKLYVAWRKGDNFTDYTEYDSLSELNKEWEDISETENTTWPTQGEDYWWICYDGEVDADIWANSRIDKKELSIGNCFRTQEEAEKAVEKLKALKRLRDKGLEFIDWETMDIGEDGYTLNIRVKTGISPLNAEDLDLLFYKEEDE